MSPVVILIGVPGSGKSTVGTLLAERLGVSFRDTDDDVERTAGMPIGDIFIEHGEERFRELEREAVRLALENHDGVLSLGGGAILDERTQAALAGHRVIYLRVDLSDAVKRVGLAQARPLLVLNPRSQLRKLMEQRRPIYERLATEIADTSGRTAEEIVEGLA